MINFGYFIIGYFIIIYLNNGRYLCRILSYPCAHKIHRIDRKFMGCIYRTILLSYFLAMVNLIIVQ